MYMALDPYNRQGKLDMFRLYIDMQYGIHTDLGVCDPRHLMRHKSHKTDGNAIDKSQWLKIKK